MQSVLEDLGPKFERASRTQLAISFATARAAVKRAQGGEAADVVIATWLIDGLVRRQAAADNVTVLASAGIKRRHRKGAPKPDISSPDALKTHAARREVDLLMLIRRARRERPPFHQGCSPLGDRPTR